MYVRKDVHTFFQCAKSARVPKQIFNNPNESGNNNEKKEDKKCIE